MQADFEPSSTMIYQNSNFLILGIAGIIYYSTRIY